NHFHFVVGPVVIPVLSTFMHRLTMRHSKRWQVHRDTVGTGPVYQGRFKALPIDGETHFRTVCRYVEENPVAASLVVRAEQWPWSSAGKDRESCDPVPLSAWPI